MALDSPSGSCRLQQTLPQPKDHHVSTEKMAFGKVAYNSTASVLIAILAAVGALVWKRPGPEINELEPRVTTMILSYDPLIIYLDSFLGEGEVKHLKKLA